MIREFQDSDLPELLAFLNRWNPDHPELGEGEIVKWQRCFKWISRSRDGIIGYIAQIPHEFRYGLPSCRVGVERLGWGVTLVLDMSDDERAQRRRSAAVHELLTAAEKNQPWQFAAVGVVPIIEEAYIRRGHNIRRDCAGMFARFLKPAKALAYLGKSSLWAPALLAANAIIRPSRTLRHGTVTRIESFDPAWDNLWDSLLSEQKQLYGTRTAEYLNYKLTQPNREYHSYTHSDNGYVIFRLATHRTKDLKLVKICDLVGTPHAKTDLASLAVDFAYKHNAHGIVALGSNDERSIYKGVGLYIARPYPIAMPAHITADMHVTFFDSDLDNLW